jgi:TatD DNase family protein
LPLLSDTHSHIDFEPFDHDRQEMLERAWQAGIQRILVPGVDLESSRRAIALAESDDRIFAAVGIHPNQGGTWDEKSLRELRAFAQHPRVCAIGEIGLDFYRDHTSPDVQLQILKDQLVLASDIDKPIILHCRNAFDMLLNVIRDWLAGLPEGRRIQNYPGVFHSFSGDCSQAISVISAGFFIGINGSITFKNANGIRELVKQVDSSRLILETDAPYITPVPHRGHRNEPAYISHTNDVLAGCLDISTELCGKMTYNSASILFNW